MDPFVNEYHYRVTTTESGQRARRGNTYHRYEVEDLSPLPSEFRVKQFCTQFLFPSKTEKRYHEDLKKDFGAAFAPYWTVFREIKKNTWEFCGVEPSTH